VYQEGPELKIRPRNRRLRNGVTLLYTMLAFIVLIGFVSLAVDFGRAQCAKTELQRAADAAARYAASGIDDGTWADKAVGAARDNLVDGLPLVLDNSLPGTPKDIEIGNWNASATPRFSTARAPANAVRVTARRVASRNAAIPLVFGRIIGRSTCDLVATAIVQKSANIPNFVGLKSLTAKNNSSAGYDPHLGTPGSSNLTSGASIASNGTVGFGNNGNINGSVLLGPSGTYTGTSPKPVTLSSTLAFPATESAPFAASGSLSVNGTLHVSSGGTLVYTSINISNNSTLIFDNPTTVYVINDILFSQNGEIKPASGLPADLRIRVIGSATSIVGGPNANNIEITAQIYAPNTDFAVHNNGDVRGTALFRSMFAANQLSLWYDISNASVVYGSYTDTDTGSGVTYVQ
jgi:hypothetical protein